MASDPQADSNVMSSINVTPFVDVVLVLLVIFIVTAPMLMKEVLEVKLPKSGTSDGAKISTLGIAINESGTILLNGQPVDESGLKLAAQSALQADPQSQAIISADQESAYKNIVKVIDLLKSSGFERYALQIEKSSLEPAQ
jgi:biopolymer transport protein ExbD